MRIDFSGATRRSEKDSQCIIPIFYSCKDCSMGSLLSENPEIFCRDIVVILPFYDNVFHRYVIRFVEGEKKREKKGKNSVIFIVSPCWSLTSDIFWATCVVRRNVYHVNNKDDKYCKMWMPTPAHIYIHTWICTTVSLVVMRRGIGEKNRGEKKLSCKKNWNTTGINFGRMKKNRRYTTVPKTR